MKIGNIEIKNKVFLAPMAGITDMPFRLICKELGAGLTYTEMVSSMGLHYDSLKTQNISVLDPLEKPAAVQIFGREPEIMAETAVWLQEQGTDIIDINMGCPAPKVVKSGHGSALMLEPKLVENIIRAVVKASKVPVTVKCRKSFDHLQNGINAVELANIAEASGASAIAVHGRTRTDFYSGEADWKIIKEVKDAVKIPVIGNGDVDSPEKAKKLIEYTNCDAVMVGRASEGNPWIFNRINKYLEDGTLLPFPTDREKIDMAVRHLKNLVEYKGENVGVKEMRKHIAWYLKGISNSTKVKVEINKLEKMQEVIDILLSINI